jgi:phospholipid/cholesterol/gamma-HCH transport system substrate-binding protein
LNNAETATEKLSKLELQKTIDEANQSIAQLKQVVEKVNQGQGSLGLLLNDKALYNNLEKTSRDLDALMIDLKQNPKNYVHFSVFSRKDKKPTFTGEK